MVDESHKVRGILPTVPRTHLNLKTAAQPMLALLTVVLVPVFPSSSLLLITAFGGAGVSVGRGPSSCQIYREGPKQGSWGPRVVKRTPQLEGGSTGKTIFSRRFHLQHPPYNFTISEQMQPPVARLPATSEQRISFLDQRIRLQCGFGITTKIKRASDSFSHWTPERSPQNCSIRNVSPPLILVNGTSDLESPHQRAPCCVILHGDLSEIDSMTMSALSVVL